MNKFSYIIVYLCLVFSFVLVHGTAQAQNIATPSTVPSLVEPDYFRQAVSQGLLPPLISRIPKTPLIVDFSSSNKRIGRYGGTLRTLGGQSKETRLMVVYGYARLVGYTETFDIKPDIVQSLDVKEGREFTFHLRPGHRWSDGAPFTTEDFRYYWQDIATNPELSALGIPQALLVNGERPRVDFINKTTVRYTWSKPNPFFLPALAAAQPLYIFRPAHFLKQFHKRYVPQGVLQRKVKQAGQRNWVALHFFYDHAYKNNNPNAPSLQPWVLKTTPPSDRYRFERNPYFHRIDTKGQQLPYIDNVVMTIASPKLIPAKTGSGETDLQARYLSFGNYTFLKQGEKRNDFTTLRWLSARGAKIALFPNLNTKDDVWRALLRSANFRRALSLGINRHDINLAVFYGLGLEGNNTVLPRSPLYKKLYRTKWTSYDPNQANALLDGLGLARKNSAGIRFLPDGREAVIIVETAGEDTEQIDVLGLIREDWQKIGIKLFVKPMQREVFRRRIFAGSTIMSVWTGLENGLANADLSPAELAPTSQQQLQWPKWGQYFESKGRVGTLPDIPAAQELAELNRSWNTSPSTSARTKIWQRMLEIHADQMFTIGLVGGISQLVVVNNDLQNVPLDGVYSWKPGALFGVYHPDTFWFEHTSNHTPKNGRTKK